MLSNPIPVYNGAEESYPNRARNVLVRMPDATISDSADLIRTALGRTVQLNDRLLFEDDAPHLTHLFAFAEHYGFFVEPLSEEKYAPDAVIDIHPLPAPPNHHLPPQAAA